jgi:ketosteroid isomerase-like protein
VSDRNTSTLIEANAAMSRGDVDAFLAHCTEDVRWTMVGDTTVIGRRAVREWMSVAYARPPDFDVSDLVAEGEVVVAVGRITVHPPDGPSASYRYADVWRFRDGLMAELDTFAIGVGGEG